VHLNIDINANMGICRRATFIKEEHSGRCSVIWMKTVLKDVSKVLTY
jgi:hypothetical protein